MKQGGMRRLALALLTVGLLSGCATGYLLDNRVQAFSTPPPLRSPATYRFERLPSQQQPAQAQLEALADPALHRAGLRRDDAAAVYSVQVSARIRRVVSPWADPWDGGWGGGLLYGPGFMAPFARMQQPWYVREVSLTLRELAANRVVFESRAINDGPWLEPQLVVPAMVEAALQGFPNAPAGVRRVDIRLGAR